MNTLKLATVVSVLALLTATGAAAKDGDTQGTMGSSIKETWRDAKNNINSLEEDYKNIKATQISADASVMSKRVVINERMTSSGMIGRPLLDANHNRLGVVEDIIIASDGTGKLIVANTGKLPGLPGKLKAFSYDAVVNRTAAGDVMTPLNQKVIDSAMEFSYDPAGTDIMTVPAGFLRVAELLKGKLIGSDGTNLANITNLKFMNGHISQVIATYGQVLSMGGENVVVSFNASNLVSGESQVNMRLSQVETEKLQNLKKVADARGKNAPISLTN